MISHKMLKLICDFGDACDDKQMKAATYQTLMAAIEKLEAEKAALKQVEIELNAECDTNDRDNRALMALCEKAEAEALKS